MGKITCSICGMSSFVKQDGVFICSTCGHKTAFERSIWDKGISLLPDCPSNGNAAR